MSPAARVFLGIVALLLAAFSFIVAVFARLYVNDAPNMFPALLLIGAFCLVIALACLVRRSLPFTLRILGAAIFLLYAWYLADEVRLFVAGQKNRLLRSAAGFLVFGLPALYVLVRGTYPRWGRHAAAFRPGEVELSPEQNRPELPPETAVNSPAVPPPAEWPRR